MRSVLRWMMVVVLLAGCQSRDAPKDPWPASCESAPAIDHPSASAARALIERALEVDRGAGISAAVVIDGKVAWRDAVGVARSGFKLTPAARMRLGSVSKIVTATMTARMADAGRVLVDEPVTRLVPEFAQATVTPRQLATHTSGIRQYNFGSMAEANSRVQYDDLADALPVYAGDPLLFDPGTSVHYSSLGYNLLGLWLQRSTATPFPDLVNKHAGFNSIVVDDEMAPTDCRPAFYSVAFGWLKLPTVWRDNSDYYPSGGMLGTAEDLAMFTYGAFSAPALTMLANPVVLPDGTTTGYTFGWQVSLDDSGEVEWYGHGGQTNGAYASVRYYPRERMAIASMSNYNHWLTSDTPAFFPAVREALPALFGATVP